jgi:hypothetical protein
MNKLRHESEKNMFGILYKFTKKMDKQIKNEKFGEHILSVATYYQVFAPTNRAPARPCGSDAFFCVLEIKLYICTKQDVMTQTQNRMTNLQFEIVKMFNYELNSNELVEIKNLLANYFQNKIDRSMDKLWTDNGWTNDTMLQMLNEHPKR